MKTDPQHIDDRLLVLYLLDEISVGGRKDVEAWLTVSDDNRDHYETLRRTWEETGRIGREAVAFDTDSAWMRLAGRIGKEDPGTVPVFPASVRMRRLWPVRLAVAAAALLVLGLVSVVLVRWLHSPAEPSPIVLASASGVVEDTLPDGSSVILNAGTELTLPKTFRGDYRKVTLKGEAFFEVEHDTSRPFVIEAGDARVTVLGTRFQVSAYPDSAVGVYVETGRVELSVPDKRNGGTRKTILNAGERGWIPKGSGRIERSQGIAPDDLYWANKKLIFRDTRLSVVFDLLKKHYEKVIVAANPDILDCRLSATFTNEPVDQILEVVAASFDLTLEEKDGRFILSGKGCSHE